MKSPCARTQSPPECTARLCVSKASLRKRSALVPVAPRHDRAGQRRSWDGFEMAFAAAKIFGQRFGNALCCRERLPHQQRRKPAVAEVSRRGILPDRSTNRPRTALTRSRLAVSPLFVRMPAYQSIEVTSSVCDAALKSSLASSFRNLWRKPRCEYMPATALRIDRCCSRRSNSRYRAPVRTRAKQLAAAHGCAQRIMGAGRVPGGKIGVFAGIVEKDPVKRIIRIVGKGLCVRLRDRRARRRSRNPRLHTVAKGRPDRSRSSFAPRSRRLPASTTSRAAAKRRAKSQLRAADELRATCVATFRIPGLKRLIHSQT